MKENDISFFLTSLAYFKMLLHLFFWLYTNGAKAEQSIRLTWLNKSDSINKMTRSVLHRREIYKVISLIAFGFSAFVLY